MLIDIKTAASELGIKTGTLYGYCSRSLVPYIKVGRVIRFDLNELVSWFKNGSFQKAKDEVFNRSKCHEHS